MNETAASVCFHCGEPLPAQPLFARVLATERAFCCTGCQAVAQAIVSSGLESYYEERTDISPTAALPTALDTLRGYDHPDTQQQFVHREENLACAELSLEGVSCAACAWLIEHRLRQEPAVRQASVNLSSHRLRLLWDDQRQPVSTLLAAIEALGYHARPFRVDEHLEALRSESRRLLMRFGVAGLGAMQVMMYSGSLYLGIDEAAYRNFLRWTCFIITIPVFLYSGYPFYRSAWNALRARALNMDVPVSLALVSTFAISVYATITGLGDIYFDSVSMFIFLLLGGRYLEMRARRQAGDTAVDLTPVLPQLAHVQHEDGSQEEVPIQQLQRGDRVMVRPGETLPCDGVVLSGHSAVSEALLTGEPLPLSKQVGDTVFGGSQNHDSPLLVEVSQPARASLLATLQQLISRALSEKPLLAQKADQLAQWLIAVILGFSALVYLGWHFVDPTRALWAMLAVLVATCPCALSLATPVALTTATHTLARLGFLATRGHVLETLSQATHVVFDKTGTLTQGRLQLSAVTVYQGNESTARWLAAALEQHSEHPVAHAFQRLKLVQLPVVEELSSTAGAGVSGTIDGKHYKLGHAGYALATTESSSRPEHPTGYLRVWLSCEGEAVASFDLQDQVRPEAAQTIAALRARGLRTVLLSGDPSEAPYQLAAQLGIDEVAGGLDPAAKTARVTELQARGGVVVMVGDGVNDAPVLGKAHVSIAMNSGADLAHIAADAVLLGDRLQALEAAFQQAGRCRQVIRQNLYWALGYNLLVIPPAALGYIPPWLAAVGMSSSSLFVVLNALRLKRIAS